MSTAPRFLSRNAPRLSAPGRRWRLKTRQWIPYLFISPFFILFGIFGLFPLLFSAYVSFFHWDGLSNMTWQGLGNYAWVLQFDAFDWPRIFHADFWTNLYTLDFWRALYNTLLIGGVAGVSQHLIAVPLAYFIHTQMKRIGNVVLAFYFLPFITNTVAITLVFQALFSTQFGIFNQILLAIGNFHVGSFAPLAWLFPTERVDFGRPEMTPWLVAFLVWWHYVGWNTVLYISALQTIPKDVYEASRIDGATGWQQFRYITLPTLRPMMFFAITLTIIGSLQMFEEPYILTGGSGGIGRVAETSAMYMLKVAMTDGDFGTASAISWLIFMLIAALTYLNNRIFNVKD